MSGGYKKAQKIQKGTLSVLTMAFLCFAVQAQAQAQKNSDVPPVGTINGRVVNENGQPLAGASLSVRAINSVSARSTTSDAEGNFRVNGLEPALYTISASLPAYTTAPSDSLIPSYYRIGDSVRLELVRGGVITGTVTNASGEPVIQVRVRALMIRDAKGEAVKTRGITYDESTDDRGVYRIYGMRAGTYLVSTGGLGFSPTFNPYDDDVPTYAPSSTRDNAAEVSVRSGEESNIDIRYRGQPGHTVSGTVKLGSNNGAAVTLVPAGGLTPVGFAYQFPGSSGFALNGIADGDYDLAAQDLMITSAPTTITPPTSLSEIKRITVKGANVTGIELIPTPLPSVSGRISLESSKAPECEGKRAALFAEMLVQPRRHEKDAAREALFLRAFASPPLPNSSGSFVLMNLLPGRYQFEPRFYARYWYLKSITLGKTDAAANWTVVKSGDQLKNLNITLAEGAGSVRGRATAEASSGMTVYLVPVEADKAEDVLRFFVTRIAADGTFAFSNLPPGRYFTLTQSAADAQTETVEKLRQPDAAPARIKLRRAAETVKNEIELKPCQNLSDYQLKQ